MSVLILSEVSALGPRCQWEAGHAPHCSMTSIREWGDTAMKNQSRNGDKILLAEITVILKHQPRGHKETKSPFLCNKSGEKKDFCVSFDFMSVCSPVIKYVTQPWRWFASSLFGMCMPFSNHGCCFTPPKQEISEITMSSTDIHVFPVDLPGSFFFFPYTSVFTGESYVLTI